MTNPTPIYSALQAYAQAANLRFHMPGHIGKMAILAPELDQLSRLDLTEVIGLDDFHMPQGIIAASQQLLQRAFHSAGSYYLVNGATSGIQSLILSLCPEGDTLILPRNAHRSFFAALVLSGARPVYLPLQYEPTTGIALAVCAAEVEKAWQKHPEARMAFLTSPSYYGTTCEIGKITETAAAMGRNILVDEAHGAHFSFHPAYPAPALQKGAGAVVQGMHKTLPVLNPGACLHLGQNYPGDEAALEACISLLSTTSPSYPLLASMERARHLMETVGEEYLDRALERSRRCIAGIDQIKGLWSLQGLMGQVSGVEAMDPLKVVVSVRETGLSGYQFARILREEYAIQLELAEEHIILALFSLLHREKDWEDFSAALQDIALRYPGKKRILTEAEVPPLPAVALTPRQAFNRPGRKMPFSQCSGWIAAEMLVPYPPGIPCVLPGEIITTESIAYIQHLAKNGAHIQGPRDATLTYLRVIEPD